MHNNHHRHETAIDILSVTPAGPSEPDEMLYRLCGCVYARRGPANYDALHVCDLQHDRQAAYLRAVIDEDMARADEVWVEQYRHIGLDDKDLYEFLVYWGRTDSPAATALDLSDDDKTAIHQRVREARSHATPTDPNGEE